MKKILLSSTLLFGLFVLMQSCQKDLPQSEVIKEITIDTTISVNTDYYFDLAPLGDEDKIATILEKGKSYSISRLEDETDMLTAIYHYKPDAKAAGTDRVVLAISQNPNGRDMVSKDSTIIYINFTVK
ncbi:MAG: hypothetical protein V4539_21555 [Bacteroidota bacterium]